MTSTTAHGELSPEAAIAARAQLPPLGKRPPLSIYVREVVKRLPFAIELGKSRFRAENEADRLGMAWIVLRPLINAAVYGFVFTLLLSGARRGPNYVENLVIGVFIFQYFAQCLTDGTRSIVQNQGLVTTLHFPRALLPISVVWQQTLALGPMVAVMSFFVVLSNILKHKAPMSATWWVLLPTLSLLMLFNLGLACFMARVTVHMRDIAQLIPFITRIFFYVGGVIIPVARFAKTGGIEGWILSHDPLAFYIQMPRDALLFGKLPSERDWLWGIGCAVVMLVVGFIWFWRAEEKYGRE